MRPISWKLYVICLCLFSLLCFFLASRGKREGAVIPEVPELSVAYYHAKGGDPGTFTTGCSSLECHPKYPHETDLNYSPFLNMHSVEFSCAVCHPIPGMKIVAGEGGEGIRLEVIGIDWNDDYHQRFKRAYSCRSCHSTSGKRMVERIINRDLHNEFVQPYALKLLEEGSKKWMVPGF